MFDKAIYNKLSEYCAYQERCSNDVWQKLQKLKADRNDLAAYISKLKDENFLNEDRYVKYFVSGHAKRKWGKTKIKNALLAKRIDAAIIKKYLDDLDEENYDEQIKTAAEKKWSTTKASSPREKKNKVLRFLLSKGYEMNKALAAIKQIET